MRVEDGFVQTPPTDDHPFCDDPVLPSLLRRLLPSDVFAKMEHELIVHGNELKEEIRNRIQVQPPILVQYDHWGRRVDDLRTSEGWRELTARAINNGYVSISHTRPHSEFSRVFAFAKVLIGTGDTNTVMCPISMSDGAARVIELHGTERMKKELLPRLTSTNIKDAYLSGQWMTERPGGSDVSTTETTATPVPAPSCLSTDIGAPYILSGFKWFSSAAEGNIAIALARTGGPASGNRGLSAFVVPLRMPPTYPSPLANGVRIHRLKNKIGTHGLPTAELELEGTRAWLVGKEGEGIKVISAMLNITRVHSAIASTGALQRALSIARSYARVRYISGGKLLLQDQPLHVATLARVALLYRALAHFTFETVRLLGKVECGTASTVEATRLRMLTPIVKAFAALRTVGGIQECMAALGGQGYMEETGIGRLMRDAAVEQIWEGTVNVLALDMIRAAKSQGSVEAFTKWVQSTIDQAVNLDQEIIREMASALGQIAEAFSMVHVANPLAPRAVLVLVAVTASATCLIEHATWSASNKDHGADVDKEVVIRWVLEGELQAARKDVCDVLGLRNVGARVTANSGIVYGPCAKL